MRIFLIGGTGFVGSRLIPYLLPNHIVTVLTRNNLRASKLNQIGVNTLIGDLTELEKFADKVERQDLVIYLAMPPVKMGRNTLRDIRKLSELIKKYLLNTVKFVKKHQCPVVFTLGTSYRTKGEEIADENWQIERFGMTLAGAFFDDLIVDLEREGIIPVMQVIPGQIYGPGGLFMRMLKMAERKNFLIFGNGKNRIPRIHVDDLVRGYVRIIDNMPLGEKYIFVDDYPCTTLEFSSCLYELMNGKPKKPIRIPAGILRIILGKYVTDTIMMDCRVSNKKAKTELGWSPVYPTYREGLKATVTEYRKGN
jgi:nucleoside-diphosphate-sugar epimerase